MTASRMKIGSSFVIILQILSIRCMKNKQNRAKLKTNHNQGSRSYVVSRELLRQELNKTDPDHDKEEEVDRITFYKHVHYSEQLGWSTPQCQENHEEMERRREATIAAGQPVDIDQIVDDVLRKRSSYVVGLGYGPKPKKSIGTSKIKMLEEALRVKEKENAELKEELSSVKAQVNKHEALFENFSPK